MVINALDVYSRFTHMLLEGAMFVYIGSIYYQNNTIEGLSKSETKSVAFMFKKTFFIFNTKTYKQLTYIIYKQIEGIASVQPVGSTPSNALLLFIEKDFRI